MSREQNKNAYSDFQEKYAELYKLFEAIRDTYMKIEKICDTPKKVHMLRLLHRVGYMTNSILTVANLEHNYNAIEIRNDSVLDHASIAVLSRSMLETIILLLYITNLKIDDTEYKLRIDIIDLHEFVSRYRYTKDYINVLKKDGDEFENYFEWKLKFKDMIEKLKNKIIDNNHFNNLTSDRKSKILEGKELYISGLRPAVREAEIDIDYFNVMYNNLSSYSHGSPMSFRRYSLNLDDVFVGVDLEIQYETMDSAFTYLCFLIEKVLNRVYHYFPEIFLRSILKN